MFASIATPVLRFSGPVLRQGAQDVGRICGAAVVLYSGAAAIGLIGYGSIRAYRGGRRVCEWIGAKRHPVMPTTKPVSGAVPILTDEEILASVKLRIPVPTSASLPEYLDKLVTTTARANAAAATVAAKVAAHMASIDPQVDPAPEAV